MIKYIKNPANIYFSLWSIYLLQGTLYANGSFISQGVLLIILLISLKSMIEVWRCSEVPVFFKGLNALVMMYTVYGLILFLTDGAVVHSYRGFSSRNTLDYMKTAYISVLPIYVCFLYTKQGYISIQMLQCWAIIFIGVGICDYYELNQKELRSALEVGSSREEFTNNAGYALMSLLPMMLVFNKKNIIQIIGIGVCLFFVISGMKRGAIIISAIALLLIVWKKMTTTSGSRKVIVTIGIAIGFFFLVQFVENMMLNSDYFNTRLQATLEGDSSGRDSIYLKIWNHYLFDTNIIEMLIGGGGYYTLKLFNVYAHNDWLEILINNGALGIVFFICYWAYFFRTTRDYRLSDASRFCLLLTLIMFLLKSAFSMSIADMNIFTTSIIGFALADGFNQINEE